MRRPVNSTERSAVRPKDRAWGAFRLEKRRDLLTSTRYRLEYGLKLGGVDHVHAAARDNSTVRTRTRNKSYRTCQATRALQAALRIIF